MAKHSERPLSPKYSVSTPSRIGQPDIKISKKDQHRAWSADKELYSFFVINPSYDPGSTEERDDKSVQFMLVGRPDIEEGDVQGRHIHAYALCKEAIYSTLENIDILDVPNVLYQFLEKNKHCYATTAERRSAYDERVVGFLYQTVDDDSCSSSAYTPGIVENTSQSQRIHAEALDERMFSYFEKRYNDISSSKDVGKMSDLTPDEREVVSIYNSFIERQNYLSAKDIRSNMKDAEYISICSRMNRMVSEAIEIVNGMPGVAFHHDKSKGSGEKDAMRRLREQNALPEKEQDSKVIALNMAILIDFPVEYFCDKEDYSLREVLKNHIDLVLTAFPQISINHEVVRYFIEEFNVRNTKEKRDEDTGETVKTEWRGRIDLDKVLNDILYPSPETSPSSAKAAKGDGVAAAVKKR